MLNPQPDNMNKAVQEATREGAEQADRNVQFRRMPATARRARGRKFSNAMPRPFRRRCSQPPRLRRALWSVRRISSAASSVFRAMRPTSCAEIVPQPRCYPPVELRSRRSESEHLA